jgi:hypothetical protein
MAENTRNIKKCITRSAKRNSSTSNFGNPDDGIRHKVKITPAIIQDFQYRISIS